ncbi:MAG: hypothetical protein H6721_06715 [Sandaracinus sp.]|nr:hypothetical protein [Sandaracinus sp.]
MAGLSEDEVRGRVRAGDDGDARTSRRGRPRPRMQIQALNAVLRPAR